jgi:hypothetical protein
LALGLRARVNHFDAELRCFHQGGEHV